MNIAIYGIGNFGYAILKHLDNKNDGSLKITAYDYEAIVTKTLQSERHHPYFFQDVTISNDIRIAEEPAQLLEKCDVLILAVSSNATREVFQHIKPHLHDGQIIVNTAKALDSQTGSRLSEVVADELAEVKYSYALFAGGTIAKDLFAHEPLGADIACENSEVLTSLKSLFESDNLFIQTTTDLCGVEYASALKNIISVIAGIVKGLGFSYGSETHIISHTAQEIGAVCTTKLGAQAATFSIGGQSWGNDMWMSCTGATRNREFGELLGRGHPVKEATQIMTEQNKTVEALNTVKVLDTLPGLKDIPVLGLLHGMLIDQTTDIQAFKEYLLKN